MASTTATREKEQQKTDDIAIVTSDEEQGVGDGNMEPVQHILIERKCLEWASPKQSFFCCAFYSILCILVGIIIVFTNNPTYDQEYNTPAQIFVTQNISLNVSEWQFNEHYVKASDRFVPEVGVWSISIALPFGGMSIYRWILLTWHKLFQTKLWVLDDDISFIKGYCILFFLCFGVVSFVSARISLPKMSAYEICDYELETRQCTKTDDATLENAWSSFPNAQMTFLVATLFFFSLYQCNKLLMFINYYFQKKYKTTLEEIQETQPILHQTEDSTSMTQSSHSNSNKLDVALSPTDDMNDSNINNNNNITYNNNKNTNLENYSKAPIKNITNETTNNNKDTTLETTENIGSSSNIKSDSNLSPNLSEDRLAVANSTNNNNNNNNNNNQNNKNSNKAKGTKNMIEKVPTNSTYGNEANEEEANTGTSAENNAISSKRTEFGQHRWLSLYIIILITVGFWPTYLAIFIGITFIHDHVAYVWDFLGSCVIGVILTWFTYGMFWDSPFETMELGYTFELSGIPRNSYYYDQRVAEMREKATERVNPKNSKKYGAKGNKLDSGDNSPNLSVENGTKPGLNYKYSGENKDAKPQLVNDSTNSTMYSNNNELERDIVGIDAAGTGTGTNTGNVSDSSANNSANNSAASSPNNASSNVNTGNYDFKLDKIVEERA